MRGYTSVIVRIYYFARLLDGNAAAPRRGLDRPDGLRGFLRLLVQLRKVCRRGPDRRGVSDYTKAGDIFSI